MEVYVLCLFFLHKEIRGPPNTFFFGKCIKKIIEYFLTFLFLFESTILQVNTEK